MGMVRIYIRRGTTRAAFRGRKGQSTFHMDIALRRATLGERLDHKIDHCQVRWQIPVAPVGFADMLHLGFQDLLLLLLMVMLKTRTKIFPKVSHTSIVSFPNKRNLLS